MKLSFREYLRGYVGEGDDADSGFAAGRRGGGAISFRGVATIDDLDAFEADPLHTADLAGEVAYAPLGRGPMRDAAIHLLVPGRAGRALVYRIAFEVGGRRYQLSGEKRIGRRPGFRAFTTLYAELFELGAARAAPPDAQPIARGRLHVPLGTALLFAFGMRGADGGRLGALRAILRFLRFVRRQTAAPLPTSA